MSDPLQKHFIYALCDPETDEVRYIGRAVNPELRLKAHLSRGPVAMRMSDRKAVWIRSIFERGACPTMIIIEETDDVHVAEAETRWIRHYLDQGANLVNTREVPGLYTPSKRTQERLAREARKPKPVDMPTPEPVVQFEPFQMYTPQNLADALGVDIKDVKKWIKEGRFKVWQLGRIIRIPDHVYEALTGQ